MKYIAKKEQKCLPKTRIQNNGPFWQEDAAAGLQLCIVNHQALLAFYNFSSWDELARFLSKLPDDSNIQFQFLLVEGQLVPMFVL